jgi:hypothetical protein
MVKIVQIFLLLFTLSSAEEIKQVNLFESTEVTEVTNSLIEKVKTFLSEDSYSKNEEFIKLIFSPETDFYRQGSLDVVKVIETLKENGLLDLFFEKPQELHLTFKTSGSPLFFVKIMGDSLRNIGYFRYITRESNFDNTEFIWAISLRVEYATDPLILNKELKKSGCSIVDIERKSATEWVYSVDVSKGYLNVYTLMSPKKLELKRSLYSHWLNVSKIQTLKINSSRRDSWYPKISYYNKELKLLKVIKRDQRTRELLLDIPKYAKYIKISDIYTLKNLKDNLILIPSGLK